MGEPQTSHFYDFRVFGRVPEPQNQLFLSLETPAYLKQSRKNPGMFSKIICLQISKFWKSQGLALKRRAPRNDEDPLNKILKYWMGINIYQKT